MTALKKLWTRLAVVLGALVLVLGIGAGVEAYARRAPFAQGPDQAGYIGRSAAKSAALNHAGLDYAYDWDCELDRDDGRMVYEVEFRRDRWEYSYEIDAYTGAVLKSEKDFDD